MILLSLDYRSRIPLCDQLCQMIAKMAVCGVLKPGEQLPSVRAMAMELGINPNTVQKAYRNLERDGILESVPGKGSFLTANGEAQKITRGNALRTLEEAMRGALDVGLSPQEVSQHCERFLSQWKERNDSV